MSYVNSPVYLGYTWVHILSSALFSFLSKILEILTSHPACSSSAVHLVISQPQNSCILPETPLWSILCPSCRRIFTAHPSQVRPVAGRAGVGGARAEPQMIQLPKSLFIWRSYLVNNFYLPSTLASNFFMLLNFIPTPTSKGRRHQPYVTI